MTLPTRLLFVLLVALPAGVACAQQPSSPPAQVAQAQPPQPSQQEEFIPIDQLPPEEQLAVGPLPGPLLVGAYAFVLAVLFLYVATVSRRLTAIRREVDRLEADLAKTGRS
jgi:CcmD family protein